MRRQHRQAVRRRCGDALARPQHRCEIAAPFARADWRGLRKGTPMSEQVSRRRLRAALEPSRRPASRSDEFDGRLGSRPTSLLKSADAVSTMFSASMRASADAPAAPRSTARRSAAPTRHSTDSARRPDARWCVPAPAARHLRDARAVTTAQIGAGNFQLQIRASGFAILSSCRRHRRRPHASAPAGARRCRSAIAGRSANAQRSGRSG